MTESIYGSTIKGKLLIYIILNTSLDLLSRKGADDPTKEEVQGPVDLEADVVSALL
jgi:hypothetical protein